MPKKKSQKALWKRRRFSCFHPDVGTCGHLHRQWGGLKTCLGSFKRLVRERGLAEARVVVRVTEDGGLSWRPLSEREWVLFGRHLKVLTTPVKLKGLR